MEELYAAPDSKDHDYLVEAPESYPTFWKRVVDLLPQTSLCLGGTGEASGGILAVGDLKLADRPCTHCDSLS